MYQAKNGFTLKNTTTPDGGEIRTAQDIVTALLTFPVFQTVADAFIWEALQQATADRKEYDDIKDLAQNIAENYI
jgi:hypothetical protein